MLRLSAGQVESLWDEVLPVEVRELPEDLAALDALLSDPGLLAPIAAGWRQQARAHGRPTISMQTYVRLMVVKHRTGWGYETLMREVSDSLHLRRFCLIALGERVPDESTVRKLTRRLGAEVVNEITRVVIEKAQAREALSAAGGADRLDRDRGGRALSDRLGVGAGLGQGAGARGTQARGEGRPRCGACAGSLAGDRAAGAGDDPHARAPNRGAQAAGAGA